MRPAPAPYDSNRSDAQTISDSSDNSTPMANRSRQIHRSLKTLKCWGAVLLGFEHRLSWGITLRECDWAEILVSEPDIQRATHDLFTTAILEQYAAKIIAVPAGEWLLASQQATLVLLSGSERFVQEVVHRCSPDTPVLTVVSSVTTRFSELTWNTIRHAAVGGATTGRLRIGSRGVQRFAGHDFVTRSLLHDTNQQSGARIARRATR